jgi:hypothetical protein
MSIQGLAIDSDVESTNTDTLGGSFVKTTGLYPVVVDMAYLGKSAKGAMSLNLHMKVANDSSIVRQTIWVTSGDAKGNKNFYTDKNGKKRLLPGMLQADQIAMITAGKSMAALTPEEKTIKLWDYETQAEKPTKVHALTEMIGQPLILGLHKIRANKVKADSNGKYINQKEDRTYNEMDKIFHADGFSVTEKVAEAEEALFHQKWADKYGEDCIDDQYVAVEGADDEDDALPAPASTKSLFD